MLVVTCQITQSIERTSKIIIKKTKNELGDSKMEAGTIRSRSRSEHKRKKNNSIYIINTTIAICERNCESSWVQGGLITRTISVLYNRWQRYAVVNTTELWFLLHRVMLSMTSYYYMFRPSGGHHQVDKSFWRESLLFYVFFRFWDLRHN
jgi:hypothetical protein